VSCNATVFRAAAYETPLWAGPNISDGRYNRAGGPATQYLSLHPMTPWAELMRWADARTPDEARAVRPPLWTIRIELHDDPERLDFDTAGHWTIDPADLVDDDQRPCRDAANAMRAAGISALIAPSAALPGSHNLVALEPAVVIDYHQEPIDPVDWPTALTAQDGRCPENLWQHVHYRNSGTPHPTLHAWLTGNEFTFEQPEVSTGTLAADR
jgi:RES domain-containing protein